jgi:hypothetical protein
MSKYVLYNLIELVSESPDDGNNPDEILKRVQDDTLVYVLR